MSEKLVNTMIQSHSTILRNCPNCGAPVNGPICEYCGSVLDQAELDRQEQDQELAKKQRQYEEMLRRWQQSVIQAELGQSIMDRMNYYGYSMSQCCCDTRTQMMQQSILQSQDYIPKPVPLVIEEKRTKDLGFKIDASDVLIWVIVMLLIAAPITALIAGFLA